MGNHQPVDTISELHNNLVGEAKHISIKDKITYRIKQVRSCPRQWFVVSEVFLFDKFQEHKSHKQDIPSLGP